MRGICCLLLVVFNVLVPFRFASYADLVSSPSDALGQPAESLEPSEPEIGGGTSDGKVFPMLYAGPGEPVAPPSYVNCVYYDVTVNGTDYTLLLPSDSESSLMVDPDGYLWNVSGSQITACLRDPLIPLRILVRSFTWRPAWEITSRSTMTMAAPTMSGTITGRIMTGSVIQPIMSGSWSGIRSISIKAEIFYSMS